MDSTEETSTKDDLSTAETSTEDVREEIEEIVLSNLQSRHRIKMLAEREAELLKKKIEMEAQLRLLEYEVTAKEEQLESLKNVTDLQKTILNRWVAHTTAFDDMRAIE
uniref:Uncharacterized protein n=1 Tax=Parascaris univalens TaxID=6257 RepID=A0A914ZX54_PARUN